ncbi:DUF4328 domain-containing protein [Amycolatopsis marina]|nr:DUF4328 domain-containing protein [Amycolatopsis marina]
MPPVRQGGAVPYGRQQHAVHPAPQPAPQRPSRPRARVRWVATVPPGALPPRRQVRAERYSGPPGYPAPPRWGFPNLVWRSPTAVPGTASGAARPMQRLVLLARNVSGLLWILATIALIAAGAEVWRYVLLVQSRNSALSTSVVATSDMLVLIASMLAFVLGTFGLAGTVWWLFVARAAAAEESGAEPARPAWQVLLGTVVPGPNLVLAGPILAELEHAVLRRPVGERPRPSRLVLAWWGAWVANGLLLVLMVVWRTRDGVQAQADGVLLNTLVDLSAVALTVLTALVVGRFTRLLAPIGELSAGQRPPRVLDVTGAPAPRRPRRPATAAR